MNPFWGSDGELVESPVITVSNYLVNPREITVEQYQKCVEAGVCGEVASPYMWPQFRQRSVRVTWEDARRFAGWLAVGYCQRQSGSLRPARVVLTVT